MKIYFDNLSSLSDECLKKAHIKMCNYMADTGLDFIISSRREASISYSKTYTINTANVSSTILSKLIAIH